VVAEALPAGCDLFDVTSDDGSKSRDDREPFPFDAIGLVAEDEAEGEQGRDGEQRTHSDSS
jgi:hypothetical protein